MTALRLVIPIHTDSSRILGDSLLTPHSWQLPPHQRLLAFPTVLSVGSEVWIETKVWKVLPVVMGFRCVSIESADRLTLCSIHGPIRVVTLEAYLQGTGVSFQAELEMPWVIQQTRFGHWLFRQWITAWAGRAVELEKALSPKQP